MASKNPMHPGLSFSCPRCNYKINYSSSYNIISGKILKYCRDCPVFMKVVERLCVICGDRLEGNQQKLCSMQCSGEYQKGSKKPRGVIQK